MIFPRKLEQIEQHVKMVEQPDRDEIEGILSDTKDLINVATDFTRRGLDLSKERWSSITDELYQTREKMEKQEEKERKAK